MAKQNCKSTLKYIICNAIVELCRQEAFYLNELKIEGTICIVSDRSTAMIFQITEEIGDKISLNEENTTQSLYNFIDNNSISEAIKVNERQAEDLFENNLKTTTEINQDQFNSIEKKDGQYNCPMCTKSYNFKHSLRDHLNKHSGLRPHHCKHCTLQFSHLSSLCAHIKKNHSEIVVGDFKCDICSQAFTTEQFLRQHITWKHTLNRKIKSQKHITFSNAENSTSNSKSIQTSNQRKTGTKSNSIKSEPVNCEDENLTSITIPTDIDNLQSQQNWFTFSQFTAQDVVSTNNYFNGTNASMNIDFNRLGADQSWLTQQNVDLQPSWSSDNRNVKKKFSIQNRFQCPYCEKNYNSKYTLKEHINKHTGCRPNVCKHCGDTFIHLASLCAHIKRVHDEHMPTEFACKICKEKLMNLQSLKQHHTWRHKDVQRESVQLNSDSGREKESFNLQSSTVVQCTTIDQNQVHADPQNNIQTNFQQPNIQMNMGPSIQPMFSAQRSIINFESDFVSANSS